MEKEKLYDKWTATGLETIKACVEDKIANYCELNKKQCQEVLNLIEKQQKEIEELNKENTRQQELIGNIHQKWKDKIKEKIEELEKPIQEGQCLNVIQGYVREGNLILLKELLGE